MKKYINIIIVLLFSISSLFAQQDTYNFSYDGVGNRIELDSPFLCSTFYPCSEDANQWLDLTLEEGTVDCGPGKCKVTASLSIPTEYYWFNYYSYDDGSGETAKTDDLQGLLDTYWCVNTGETLTLTVYLYRSLNDPDPCVLVKEAGCDLECCNYINMNLIPIASNDPNYCCWMPNITTDEGAVCDLSDVNIEFFDATGVPITLGANGEICRPSSFHQPNSPILQKKIKYKITVYGEQCGNVREVVLNCGSCDCPSAAVLNSWVKLDIDKYDPLCSAGDCKITAKLEIPTIYQACYTSYRIAYKISDGTNVGYGTNPPNPIPPSGILPDLPNCIPAGTKISYSVYLYGQSGSICEAFSNEVYCTKIENQSRPTACDPEGDPWFGYGTINVTIGGCTYIVTYQYRKTAPPELYQDVQLLSVEAIDDNCPSVNVEDIFKEALPGAIAKIINTEEDFKPQKLDNEPCYDMWRVLQNSCWAKWRCFDGFEEFNVWLPCESECCARKLRVCQTETGISVEDIDFASGSGAFNCSLAQTLPNVIPINSSSQTPNCEDRNCDIYEDIYKEWDQLDEHRKIDFDNFSQATYKKHRIDSKLNSILFRHQALHNSNTLNILIAESVYENITISVLDLLGKQILTKSFDISGNEQSINLDLGTISSGAYFYNIISDGKMIGSGKIVITK